MSKLPVAAPRQRGKVLATIGLFLVCLAGIGMDQATKLHSEKELLVWAQEGEPALYQGSKHSVFEVGSGANFLSLSTNYVRNPGAAWGTLAKVPESIRVPLFYTVTALALGLVGWFLKTTPWSKRIARYALVLIVAGAIGNFIDRVRLSYVIDWIYVRWSLFGWHYNFPAFNIADVFISVGIAALIFEMILNDVKSGAAKATAKG